MACKITLWRGRSRDTIPFAVRQAGEYNRTGQPVFVLVPEQFTLQAERELLEGLDLPGMFQMEVLSPGRLRTRIMELVGCDTLPALNDMGKAMLLRRCLKECDLRFFASAVDRFGLPGEIALEIDELQDAGLTPEDLLELSGDPHRIPSQATRAKLEDLSVIWTRYLQLMENRFLDEAGQTRRAVQGLAASGMMTDANLVVVGFDAFQADFRSLLCEAARYAATLDVIMACPAGGASNAHVFAAQQNALNKLADQLHSMGLPFSWKNMPDLTGPGRPETLEFLERELFSHAPAGYAGESRNSVQLHACPDPFSEAAFAARVLRSWHDRDGIAWHDMAVTLSGAASPALMRSLTEAGIPAYMAHRHPVPRHGLCRYLLYAARCVAYGCRQPDVLEVMRSGFSPLDSREAALLECYALEHGIRHSKWLKPFTLGDAEKAEQAEALRLRLITPIREMHQRLLASKDAAASLSAVYRFLEDSGSYEALCQDCDALEEQNMPAEVTWSRQVWQLLMDLLDQMYALLDGARPTLKDLSSYIEAALSCSTLSSLPPVPEMVMVGDVGHLLPGQVKAMLVMGLQDGTMTASDSGLLTDNETARLSQLKECHVGLTPEEKTSLRLSDFFKTLTLPERRLAITWCSGKQNGAADQAASLIDDLGRMFPDSQDVGAPAEDSVPPVPGALL